MNTVVKVENLSKQYRLGEVSTGSLSHDINRWWHRMLGKENPYLQVGEENDRTQKGTSDYIWALRDIGFEVKQGEVLGIIGKNGAGKSTLLKLLSKTTGPTTGTIKIKGRVASLLEVGTGFHPDLSGRQNVFLNGAILGMSKKEIYKKFEEIVDFAGVERYIDTPVKRYSSGMYVRLAFAVAAHLEPEILIVDEVLAVGDAAFQKKCLGKMKDVSRNGGRTVLFVSHNMGAIKGLFETGILLENGMMKSYGDIDEVVEAYFKRDEDDTVGIFKPGKLDASEKVIIKNATIRNQRNEITESFNVGDDLLVDLTLVTDEEISNPNFGVGIKSRHGYITIANTMFDGSQTNIFKKGENHISITFKNLPLLPQEYYLGMGMRTADGKTFLMQTKDIGYFVVVTRMRDLGINGSLAEEIVVDSVSPFIPYEWNFGNGAVNSFNILDHVKR